MTLGVLRSLSTAPPLLSVWLLPETHTHFDLARVTVVPTRSLRIRERESGGTDGGESVPLGDPIVVSLSSIVSMYVYIYMCMCVCVCVRNSLTTTSILARLQQSRVWYIWYIWYSCILSVCVCWSEKKDAYTYRTFKSCTDIAHNHRSVSVCSDK